MRIIFINLLLFVCSIMAVSNSSAQVSIVLNDVAKIHLVDGGGYLGGSYRNDYELVNESGKWVSYQTKERYYHSYFKGRSRSKPYEKKDSVEHRYIKTVPIDSINMFLNAISTVKPEFIAADLKVSIRDLTKQIDTGSLKHLDPKQLKIFNSFFNTPAKLNQLLDTAQHDSWTDDFPFSAIEVIDKKGDTTKVVTTQQVPYMLPWEINKVPTYDLRINHFFITVTNLTDHRMSGKYLSSQIYRYVDHLYAEQAFELLRWRQTAPENLKYIRRNFDIIDARRSNENSVYTFHSKALNAHILIKGFLNINDKDQLLALTRYATDTLKVFIKAGGFMIDSCLQKRGCNITLGNNFGQSTHNYFTLRHKSLDVYLKQINSQDLRPFTITAGDRTEDDWIKLPDGNFLLTAYLDDYAVGVLPQYIKKDGVKRRKFVYMIFSPTGKLISNSDD